MASAAITFGSFGDIVTIIQLVTQLYTVLSDIDGAPAEIRSLDDALEGYLDELTLAERTLLCQDSHFDPQTRSIISRSLKRCESTLRAIQRQLDAFSSRIQKRAGRQILGARFWALMWLLNAQRELHALAERNRATAVQVLCSVQDIPRYFGAGVPEFQFYDEETRSYYKPVARVALHDLQQYMGSAVSLLRMDYAELCVPSDRGRHYFDMAPKLFVGRKRQLSRALRDHNSALWRPSHYLAWIRLCSLDVRSFRDYTINCLFYTTSVNELHALLGVKPSHQYSLAARVISDVLRGDASNPDNKALYVAEHRKESQLLEILRGYNYILKASGCLWSSNFNKSEEIVELLVKFPQPDFVLSSPVFRSLESTEGQNERKVVICFTDLGEPIKARISLATYSMPECEARRCYSDLRARLQEAPRISESVITHNELSQSMEMVGPKGWKWFRYTDRVPGFSRSWPLRESPGKKLHTRAQRIIETKAACGEQRSTCESGKGPLSAAHWRPYLGACNSLRYAHLPVKRGQEISAGLADATFCRTGNTHGSGEKGGISGLQHNHSCVAQKARPQAAGPLRK
ncbi:hypothetical protein AURDEDRAFT_128082 [Auricularia subglabra TFB-10046 SS5]|uniref:Uncharacterized protein n=1 Tax=Auricularia subglabra (strain TFB-10046 / SS5) TaxID=717982 RepID=J0LJ31_AURST|nr:hypothetical protein AURDEDRAFT_128082 [Auricularia subglabra TFB-10046 SS5]